MRHHKIFSSVIIFLALTSVAGWTNRADASRRFENDSVLTFKVISDKQTYILGEEVKLNFKVINEGDKPVLLYSPTVYNGYMKVWISTDGEEYKRYSGNSDWGLDDRVGGTTLQA